MNSLDYSKGDLSRARTADYLPGQSITGIYTNGNLKYSRRGEQSQYEGRVYPGDASQYYINAQQNPSQSYQQRYSRQMAASQSFNPKLAHSEHVIYQLPESYRYPGQMGQSAHYVGQQQAYYIPNNAHYMPQQPQPSSQPYKRQFLSFRPMMGNQINQVAQSRIPLDNRQPYHQYDFKIFCPACHQQYYNSQVEEHIQRHYLYNTDQFKLSNLMDTKTQLPEVVEPQQQTISNPARFYYPLIEPQQFECKELDEVDYLNKYKLHHQELNKKQSNVKVKSQSTQFAKPPLQLKSENTDIYNCFDSIFSSNNTFDVNDVTKNNHIIAKKRHLDDWEKLRSHKEGYKIRTN